MSVLPEMIHVGEVRGLAERMEDVRKSDNSYGQFLAGNTKIGICRRRMLDRRCASILDLCIGK